MRLNLLKLHKSREDTKSRQLLRIYSVIPKYVEKPDNKNEKAVEIVKILRKTRSKINQKFGFGWQKEWLKRIGYSFSSSTPKDWFIGRSSIPLIAISKFKDFGCQSEVSKIMKKAEYFCSTTGKASKIPCQLNEDTAYLAGAILCDGHLRKDGYSIYYELTEKRLMQKFRRKIRCCFDIERPLKERNGRPGCKKRYCVHVDNKPIFRFFNCFFSIPRGKKSDRTTIPEIVIKSDKKIKSAFLEGVFDTDGGKRRRGYGLSTASIKFREQTVELLKEFGVKTLKDEWINKKYNKKYFGLSFHKRYSFLPFLHG